MRISPLYRNHELNRWMFTVHGSPGEIVLVEKNIEGIEALGNGVFYIKPKCDRHSTYLAVKEYAEGEVAS